MARKTSRSQSHKHIREEEKPSSEDEISGLNILLKNNNYTSGEGKQPVQMEIYTGAVVTVTSQEKCPVQTQPTKKLHSTVGQLWSSLVKLP